MLFYKKNRMKINKLYIAIFLFCASCVFALDTPDRDLSQSGDVAHHPLEALLDKTQPHGLNLKAIEKRSEDMRKRGKRDDISIKIHVFQRNKAIVMTQIEKKKKIMDMMKNMNQAPADVNQDVIRGFANDLAINKKIFAQMKQDMQILKQQIQEELNLTDQYIENIPAA